MTPKTLPHGRPVHRTAPKRTICLKPMSPFPLKPTHAPVKAYYAALAQFHFTRSFQKTVKPQAC